MQTDFFFQVDFFEFSDLHRSRRTLALLLARSFLDVDAAHTMQRVTAGSDSVAVPRSSLVTSKFSFDTQAEAYG